MIKKIVVLIVSLVIALCPCISFADDTTSPSEIEWIPITSSTNYEISYAVMKAYLHARNAGYKFVFGENAPDLYEAEAKFSFEAMKAIFQKANLNFPYGDIYYYFDDNIPLQFWYSASGLLTLDAFYEAWLDYYGISADEEKIVYDGKAYIDTDNYVTFMYNVKNRPTRNQYSVNWVNLSDLFNNIGTEYRYTSESIWTLYQSNNQNFYLNDGFDNLQQQNGNIPVKNQNFFVQYGYYNRHYYLGPFISGSLCDKCHVLKDPPSNITQGIPIITYLDNQTYPINICILTHRTSDNKYTLTPWIDYNFKVNDISDALDAMVKIGQGPLKDIGIAAGKAAIIETGKKGADAIPDYIKDPDPDDKEPSSRDDDPTDNPPSINKKSINIGTIINNNGDINVQLPDLNDVDPDPQPLPAKWLMSAALKTKFPFCIPFDLIAIYSLLDTEPQAPRIQQDINFPTFTYHFDLNLEDYDEPLENARKFFLVLYIFGLLFVTPKLLKA